MICTSYFTPVFEDACNIIETAQKVAYSAVDLMLVHRNWLLGKRIDDDVSRDFPLGKWKI